MSTATVLAAASADAASADFQYDGAVSWFAEVLPTFSEPLAVETGVFSPDLAAVLLVRHRWRGWVPPGGAVEPGELPRDAAVRELWEETGLQLALLARPAAVAVRSYRREWPPTLGLSYVAIVDRSMPAIGEADQPTAWRDLLQPWDSYFPADRPRMIHWVDRFGPAQVRAARVQR